MENLSLLELQKKLRSQEISCLDLVQDSLDTIKATDDRLRAFLHLFKEEALESAQALDYQFKKGEELPPLAGIPISIKDNICIRKRPATCASKMLEDYIAPFDATVIKKLKAKKAICIGKVNMDEFAMGSSTENSAFQVTSNPWNLDHVPGGSSGGSAASVASGQVLLSLGSDTGGSIRQPAAFCGISGFKPSYGRVSRYGLVAFASSLDQIGPFAKRVEDLAEILTAISGYDPYDATSADLETPHFKAHLNPDIKGLKIGVPKEILATITNDEIKASFIQALDKLSSLGAQWQEVSMASFKASIPTYYILAPAEASSNLARFDGVRYTKRAQEANNIRDMFVQTRAKFFGPEVKRRIILGTFVLSSGYYDAYYGKAQKARAFVIQEFNTLFQNFDLIITPTTPSTAFKKSDKLSKPMDMYVSDILTIPANLAGLPALSIPCGFDSQSLPIGIQLIGKSFDEQRVLNVGYAYQQVTSYHLKQPNLKKEGL